MPNPTNKTLILSLIKDDLIHHKLLSGLNALQLSTTHYCLGLSDTIFELMKIKDDEAGERLFEYYLKSREEIKFIDFTRSHDRLEDLAKKIYDELRSRSPLSL